MGPTSWYAVDVDCCGDDGSSTGPTPATTKRSAASTWKRGGTTLAAILVALLPKCPACWSAYAGLSSLLGLSFVVEERYLLPLTAGLLSLAVGALAHKAQRGGGYGPSLLGLVASGGVLVGKFGVESPALMYTSVSALLLATLWSGRLGTLLQRSLSRRFPGFLLRVTRRLRTAP